MHTQSLKSVAVVGAAAILALALPGCSSGAKASPSPVATVAPVTVAPVTVTAVPSPVVTAAPAATDTAPVTGTTTTVAAPASTTTVTVTARPTATVTVTKAAPGTAGGSSCASGTMAAKIGGVSKCIKARQACLSKYAKDYEQYGFVCTDQNGQYILEKKAA